MCEDLKFFALHTVSEETLLQSTFSVLKLRLCERFGGCKFMSKRDYYEVLGLSKGASTDEIKKRIVVWLKNTIQT